MQPFYTVYLGPVLVCSHQQTQITPQGDKICTLCDKVLLTRHLRILNASPVDPDLVHMERTDSPERTK